MARRIVAQPSCNFLHAEISAGQQIFDAGQPDLPRIFFRGESCGLFEFPVKCQVAHPECIRDAFDVETLHKKFEGLSREIRQVRLVCVCGREALRDDGSKQGHCQTRSHGPASQRMRKAYMVQLGKAPPKCNTPVHLHRGHVQNAFPKPCIKRGAAQFQPVFGPARFRVGPITVPVAGREQKYRARRETCCSAPKFKPPSSLRDGNQLESGENPTALPGEGATFRMPWRWIGHAGKDAGMPDCGHMECPNGFLRTCGKIFEIVFDRLLYESEISLHARQRDIFHGFRNSSEYETPSPFSSRWSVWNRP